MIVRTRSSRSLRGFGRFGYDPVPSYLKIDPGASPGIVPLSQGGSPVPGYEYPVQQLPPIPITISSRTAPVMRLEPMDIVAKAPGGPSGGTIAIGAVGFAVLFFILS